MSTYCVNCVFRLYFEMDSIYFTLISLLERFEILAFEIIVNIKLTLSYLILNLINK